MRGAPNLRVEIAAAVLELRLPAGPVRQALEAAWAPFRTVAPATLFVDVELDERPGITAPQFPEIKAEAGRVFVRGEDFEAKLEGPHACVRQRVSRYPVELAIKLLLAAELARRGGLLLHGVCLGRERDAALFVVQSGGGKSTLGELGARDGLVRLADELVAVWPAGDGYRVAGTPWNIGLPEERRLVAVGTLGKTLEPRIVPLPPAELLRTILPNALLPEPTPEGRARLFRDASRLLSRVPACRFDFPPTAAAVMTLRTLLRG